MENLPQLTNDSVNLPKSTSESENLYKSTIESENLYKSTSESVDLHESSNDSEKLSIDADSSYKKDGMDKVRAHASNISAFYWISNILIMNIMCIIVIIKLNFTKEINNLTAIHNRIKTEWSVNN